ncbi:unnamed protein product [Ectocarpus fasciculatus]
MPVQVCTLQAHAYALEILSSIVGRHLLGNGCVDRCEAKRRLANKARQSPNVARITSTEQCVPNGLFATHSETGIPHNKSILRYAWYFDGASDHTVPGCHRCTGLLPYITFERLNEA